MINFEKLPSGDLRNTGWKYVRITPGADCQIDIDGSFTIEEFEQILETAKAAREAASAHPCTEASSVDEQDEINKLFGLPPGTPATPVDWNKAREEIAQKFKDAPSLLRAAVESREKQVRPAAEPVATSEQPQSTVATDTPLPGFVSLG